MPTAEQAELSVVITPLFDKFRNKMRLVHLGGGCCTYMENDVPKQSPQA